VTEFEDRQELESKEVGCYWPGYRSKKFDKWYKYFMLGNCMYILIMYLMRFAFENGKPNPIVIFIDLYLNFVFLIDMIRCFTVPYTEHNKDILKKKMIARRYVQFWFWIDVYGFYPLAWLRWRSRREDGSLDE